MTTTPEPLSGLVITMSSPTFAKLDETKTNKWKQSSERFTENVISEELRAKLQQTSSMKKQLSEVYSEIRQKCSFFRYLCILKTIALLRKKHYQKMSDDHTSKISRLLNRDIDVDEHIQNISSYRLTFFDKLVLCRRLKFSIPQPRISAMDIQAAFEKAYWKLEPTLPDDKKGFSRSDPSLDRAQLHRKKRAQTT